MSAVDTFLQLQGPCFDVRSPKEFAHAHIPGAISLPLFTDSERCEVGTVYKKVGKNEAIRLGVSYVGPRLSELFDKIQEYGIVFPKKIYCYRGGMRSGFVQAFLQSLSIDTIQLEGGYKAFRRKVLKTFDHSFPLCVLGGMAGSGKTELLQALEKSGQHAIDLESIACHRGSVFGEYVDKLQPSTEQFENELASKLFTYSNDVPIWIEDESRLIGHVVIPQGLFSQMQRAPLFLIQCPFDERFDRIMRLYSVFPKQWWVEKTKKIAKRLGSEKTASIICAINQERLEDAVVELLQYYDKTYTHALSKRSGPVIELALSGTSFSARTTALTHSFQSYAHERAFDRTVVKTV